jgi:hypothetical protein
MASHAHNPGDSRRTPKAKLYGGIAAALITAGTPIGVAVVNHIGSDSPPIGSVSTAPTPPPPVPSGATASKPSEPSTWTTITPTPVSQGSDQGPVDKYAINASGTEVKVWGHADRDADGMIVLIGPQPSGGFWPAFANVVNHQWQADVKTDPQISEGYKVWAIPHTPSGGAPGQSPVKFTFQATGPTSTTPPPPPAIMNCAAQHGPDCFTGPGWGPPSVYQPNQ